LGAVPSPNVSIRPSPEAILRPRPGERLLEIGLGVSIHALSIAAASAPNGILDGLDIQRVGACQAN
jgi:ubiquinone/menaquinone biosynthesis C-methylase UbiE